MEPRILLNCTAAAALRKAKGRIKPMREEGKIDLGMPTLIELPEIEDCAALCAGLGLQFIELNMNMPQYQADILDVVLLT